MVIQGDSKEKLRELEAESHHSCVTDPPYEMGFMNRQWDESGIAFDVEFWEEVKRVLKPGAHLASFGGSRTHHRMMAAIEDAGFEIRDTLMWVYGGGFPKSLDVSKAIDKKKGEEREVVGQKRSGIARNGRTDQEVFHSSADESEKQVDVTAPSSEEAKRWDGWGTALKPGYEPICLARKPLSEDTVAENVLTYGTGAINIDDCRIGNSKSVPSSLSRSSGGNSLSGSEDGSLRNETGNEGGHDPNLGRWPNNFLVDERASVMLNEQSGQLHSQDPETRLGKKDNIKTLDSGWPTSPVDKTYGDSGGASRFYKQIGREGEESAERTYGEEGLTDYEMKPGPRGGSDKGRFPANFILEEEAAELLNEQSGTLHSRGNVNQSTSGGGTGNTVNPGPKHKSEHHKRDLLQKDGGAARFFYCPKSHKSERNIGTDENEHPTVKPVELISYLIRLTTPEGGKTLDPFGGSGTAGIAAVLEQKGFTLIEKDPDHYELAEKRIEHVKANVSSIREQIYDDPSNELTKEGNEVNHDFW